MAEEKSPSRIFLRLFAIKSLRNEKQNELYEKWSKRCYKAVAKGSLSEYKKNIKQIVKDFTDIKLKKKIVVMQNFNQRI